MIQLGKPSACLTMIISTFLFVSCSKKKLAESAPAANTANYAHSPLNGTTVFGGVYTPGETETVTDFTHLNELFSPLRYTPQTFSVAAGQAATLHGAQGTLLYFYPHSFKNASGNIITGGTVQIQLIEMYKPGAMIANRATTTANGGLLISGGQVRIIATMNNQPVYANKYGIGFKQPASSAQPMSLYYGNTNNADSVTEWNITNVAGPGTTVANTVTVGDTAQGYVTVYLFDSCNSFNWINCDHFYNQQPITNVFAVTPDTSFKGSNTTIYMIFPAINSVVTFHGYTPATHTFDLSAGYKVPVGMTVTIVAMTIKNGNYYYYQQPNITVTDNMSLNLNLQQQSYAYVTNALLNL